MLSLFLCKWYSLNPHLSWSCLSVQLLHFLPSFNAQHDLFRLASCAVSYSPMSGKILLCGAVDCSDMLREVVFAVEFLGTVWACMPKTWPILMRPFMSSAWTMRKERHPTHNAWIGLLGRSAKWGSLPARPKPRSSALNDGPNTSWSWYPVYGIERSRDAWL